MQQEQIRALRHEGMSCEDISREMQLDLTLVKTMCNEDPEAFSGEERAIAKNVIFTIAQGGMDINARDQLKAALYIHSGKQSDGNVGLAVLQELIIRAKQQSQSYQKVIDVTP